MPVAGGLHVRETPRGPGGPGGASHVIELVEDLAHLESLGEEIDHLHARTGAPASARWAAVHAGLRHEPRAHPWCLVVRRGPDMVAAGIAVAQLRLGAWDVRSATHPHEPGWLAALDEPASDALAEGIVASLAGLHRPWRLEWAHLPAADLTLAALLRRLPVSTALPSGSAARVIPDAGDGLSRNTRSVVSRARKRMAAAGLACDIAWARDPQVIAANLDEVVVVHQRRNRQLRGSAGLDDPAQRALFEDTVRAQAAAGRARLLTLRLDGALAAFAICFESAGILHVYSNMASPDRLEFSPGTVANAEVVRAARADPALLGVDWGLGLQRYKLSGSHVRIGGVVRLWAWSSLAGRVAWALGDMLARR